MKRTDLTKQRITNNDKSGFQCAHELFKTKVENGIWKKKV